MYIVKRIIRSRKYFGAATLCFLLGVTSFHLHNVKLFERPKSIVTDVTNERVMQASLFDTGSSRFYKSTMVELQESVSRTMPSYEFGRAFCTCPGIISDQQSYSYGILDRGGSFAADVYVAESRSSIAAKKWIEDSRHSGSDQFLRAPNLDAVRSRNANGHDLMILIRLDRYVFQISGEASGVEALAKGMLRQLPAS